MSRPTGAELAVMSDEEFAAFVAHGGQSAEVEYDSCGECELGTCDRCEFCVWVEGIR